MQNAQQTSWQFVIQALNDFAQTLPPSARHAFEQVAQQHLNGLTTPEPESGPE